MSERICAMLTVASWFLVVMYPLAFMFLLVAALLKSDKDKPDSGRGSLVPPVVLWTLAAAWLLSGWGCGR